MMRPEIALIAACTAAALLWAALAAYVGRVQARRAGSRAIISRAIATLHLEEVARLPLEERLARLRPLVASASRELIMYTLAGADTSTAVADVLAVYLAERWGIDSLERDASSHRTPRDKWRRIAALRILSRLNHPRAMELLAQAIDERDAEVATAALSLLGASTDVRAADLLVAALKRHSHPASQIALHLDRSPQDLGERLRPLLHEADPVTRLWGATLLARYPDLADVERDLAEAADDGDPRVRKAAVQTLAHVGDVLAGVVALRLLTDRVPFVRATAARALGRLNRTDLADEVSELLADRDWSVRFAAKQSLETMGPEVWPVLARCLDHSDRFVRNGAAEVFQNLGVLDSLIVIEAATDDPAAARIDMLRRIAAAGGLRLTDSLMERTGAKLGPRVRSLLTSIGLEHVEAA